MGFGAPPPRNNTGPGAQGWGFGPELGGIWIKRAGGVPETIPLGGTKGDVGWVSRVFRKTGGWPIPRWKRMALQGSGHGGKQRGPSSFPKQHLGRET